MSELHKRVLELLGFEVRKEKYGFKLYKRDDVEAYMTNEADAWAQAPDAETLIPKLIQAMRGVEFAELCISFAHDRRYDLVLFNSGEAIYAVENTLAEAVCAIFVAACEDKLIDGKAVTL